MFFLGLMWALPEIQAGEDGVRCAHGAQFVSLCTNKPSSGSSSGCQNTTNVSLTFDVFLQDFIITISTLETGSPALINLTVTNTFSSTYACITDLTTVEFQAVDGLGATYFDNLHDYEQLRSNRSIFPTFGNEYILTATDGLAADSFGRSVAISGDGSTLAIGAPGKNGGRGAFYIFQRQPSSWAQAIEVLDPAGIAADNFGRNIAISHDGTVIAVSAASGAGAVPTVYIYSYNSFTNQVALLQTIPGVAAFGFNLAMSATGQYIVISDLSATPKAFVYARQNSCSGLGTTWVLQQTLTTQVAAGASVAISPDGTVIAVGVILTSPSSLGVVYLYNRSNNVWNFNQTVTSSDGVANDQFGIAVALSGNGQYLLVGARNATPSGKAYEFVRRGPTWLQEHIFLPTGLGSNFGTSLALSSDGTVALFGAATSGIGAAYIAFRSPDNMWAQPFVFAGHTGNAAFGIATALSLDGAFAAVGAPDFAVPGTVSLFTPSGAFISSDAIITGSLCVYGETTVNGDLFVTGSIFTNQLVVSGGVTPCTPSDWRLKHNVKPLAFAHAWNKLSQLRPVIFSWKNPSAHQADGARVGGFIAQEVEANYPHWVIRLPVTGPDAALIPLGEQMLHLAITPEILAYFIAVIKHLYEDDAAQREILSKIIVSKLAK